ncbi:MAG: YcdB/YcdC domain-containing protein [Tumebacillaceae bacterium]
MKRMKTMTAVALTLGMLFAGIPFAVYADVSTTPTAPTEPRKEKSPAVSKEQAIANAKQLAGIPDDFKFDRAMLTIDDSSYPYSESATWRILFEKGSTDDKRVIEVTIDADDGTLLAYEQLLPTVKPSANAISQDAARTKAEQYLKQLTPDKSSSVVAEPTGDATHVLQAGVVGYRFSYVRTYNGIPYPEDSIQIDVGPSGELQQYRIDWSKGLQFPSATPSITLDQATATFRNVMPLQLGYASNQYDRTPLYLRLQYGLLDWENEPQEMMIDAQNGGAILKDGTSASSVSTAPWQPLADKPGSPVTTQPITEQVARDLVSQFNLGLDGYSFDHANRMYTGEFVEPMDQLNGWELFFTKTSSGSASEAAVLVDARSGELLGAVRYDRTKAADATHMTLTKEQAKQKAIDFITKAMPSKLPQIALDPTLRFESAEDPGVYAFYFQSILNGVPVENGGWYVMIDGTTGATLEYLGDSDVTKITRVSATTPVVSLETAKDKFHEKYPLRLQYEPIFEKSDKAILSEQVNHVALVYAPNPIYLKGHVDAVTGDVSTDKVIKAPAMEITDIKGHWAEKQLQTYAEQGVFEVNDGKLEPNHKMTRAEIIDDWMVALDAAFGKGNTVAYSDVPKESPYFPVIADAYADKWIDPSIPKFRPNEIMTRAELADLVARTLGKGKITSKPGATKAHFSDVSSTGASYAAINAAVSYGIMGGSYGAFAPNQPVTRAQLAVVMSKVQAYQETQRKGK